MKLIDCPHIGPRPASEFVYGGPYRRMPDPDAVDDKTWTEYVFNRAGSPGVKLEWWYHTPSGSWFIAERDTLRDLFLRTLTVSEVHHGHG
ncbi:MAG TPA: sarcosine oxidase subunit delta [Candidatus Competibacteraceae bacterium]|nr:sarcosine oxidase subunit delta [Candidatus Competibacteraceae bacterium]